MRNTAKGIAPASDEAETDPRDAMDVEDTELARRSAFPAVAQRKGASDTLTLVAAGTGIALLGGLVFWSLGNSRTNQGEQGVGGVAAQEQVPPVARDQPAQAAPQPDQAQTVQNASPPAAVPAPVYTATTSSLPPVQSGPVGNPYSSPTVVYDVGRTPSAAAAALSAEAATGVPTAPGGGSAGDFASRIGGGAAAAPPAPRARSIRRSP